MASGINIENIDRGKTGTLTIVSGTDLNDIKRLIGHLDDKTFISRSKGLDREYILITDKRFSKDITLKKYLHDFINKDQGWK